MIVLLLAIPFLLLLSILLFGVPIYLFAKAKGDISSMSPRRKTFFFVSVFAPLVLFVGILGIMWLYTSNAKNELAKDIESGEVIVYRVDESNKENTQQIVRADASGAPYLSFSIFSENLYAEEEEGRAGINIRTREFEGVPTIKRDSVAFVRFVRYGAVLGTADMREERFKDERIEYVRTETALGTAFEVEEKESAAGRFLYQLYLKDIDYYLLVSASYLEEDSLQVKYAPVVSREYAKALYDLILSSLQVEPSKVHEVHNLEAI